MKISWTKYDSFTSCSLQYKLRYEHKVKYRRARLPYLIGLSIHKIIKGWAESGYKSGLIERITPSIFNKEAVGIAFASREAYQSMFRKVMEGALITAKIYTLLSLPKNGAVIEKWFDVKLPERKSDRLVGGVDVYDPVTETIYDLKLYTFQNYGKRGQVMTYAVALDLQGVKVKNVGFITPFLTRKVISLPIQENEIEIQKKLIINTIEILSKGVVGEPNMGQHCYFCEYKNSPRCPSTFRDEYLAEQVKKKLL